MERPVIVKGFKDENLPYFFRNDDIAEGKQTYIVQKASSIGQALAICDRWKREQFNITDSTTELLYHVPYTKYLYDSNTKIVMLKVTPDEDKKDKKEDKKEEKMINRVIEKFYHDRDYEILMYKKDGRINVVALLPYTHGENNH